MGEREAKICLLLLGVLLCSLYGQTCPYWKHFVQYSSGELIREDKKGSNSSQGRRVLYMDKLKKISASNAVLHLLFGQRVIGVWSCTTTPSSTSFIIIIIVIHATSAQNEHTTF